MGSVYLSYTTHNKVRALLLVAELQAAHFSVSLPTEENERLAAVARCAVFIPLMTPDAYTDRQVTRECQHAEALGKTAIPILMEGSVFPQYREVSYIDMREQTSPPAELLRLLRDQLPPSETDDDQPPAAKTTLGKPKELRALAQAIRKGMKNEPPANP